MSKIIKYYLIKNYQPNLLNSGLCACKSSPFVSPPSLKQRESQHRQKNRSGFSGTLFTLSWEQMNLSSKENTFFFRYGYK